MTAFRIQIDIGIFIPPNMPVSEKTFPALAAVFDGVVGRTQIMWRGYASGAVLPDGRSITSRSGQYKRSIQRQDKGPFAAEIYSRLPYAEVLEKGGPARDLKRMLDTSSKVRISKKGKRYLIIPFRHGTPEAVTMPPMPEAVHKLWTATGKKKLEPSYEINSGKRLSGTGAMDIKTRRPIMVTAQKYRWGDRLTKAQLASAGVSGRQKQHLAGMVNLRDAAGKHSQFLTFRVMTEDSDDWKTKVRKGYWPARTTADRMRPIAEKLLQEAAEEDIRMYERMIGG